MIQADVAKGWPVRVNVDTSSLVRTRAIENAQRLREFYGAEWSFNHDRADRPPELGLALSGGGMRSASFCMGVLEALNRRSLLDEFDIMSSVSGGAYTLSWYYLQQFYKNNTSAEFRNEMFCHTCKYQQHVESHGRLFASGNQWSWSYYVGATRDLLESIVLIPVNLAENLLFAGHTNTSALRLGYQNGIEEAFHVQPSSRAQRFVATTFPELSKFVRDARLPLFIINCTAAIDDDIGHQGAPLTNTVFEFTPLGYGSDAFNYVLEPRNRSSKRVPPALMEWPVDFNTAVAISGAAADSWQIPGSAEKVLGSAFNLDLGYYIYNYNEPQGLFSMATIGKAIPFPFYFFLGSRIRDVTGTDIYLSDGGHSDNLGLFSLIRRMCKNIIVVDAEHDPTYSFESYRKVKSALRAEMGLTLEVPEIDAYLATDLHVRDVGQAEVRGAYPIQRPTTRFELGLEDSETKNDSSKSVVPFDVSHPAMRGRVYYVPYKNSSGSIELVTLNVTYLKLSLDPSRIYEYPDTVQLYYRDHWDEFPHETTADQNYEAGRYRAYRDLGATMTLEALKNGALLQFQIRACLKSWAKRWQSLIRRIDKAPSR